MMKEGVGSIEPFSDSMGETYSNNRRRLGGDGGGGGSGVRPSQVNKVADGQMEHILSRFAQNADWLNGDEPVSPIQAVPEDSLSTNSIVKPPSDLYKAFKKIESRLIADNPITPTLPPLKRPSKPPASQSTFEGLGDSELPTNGKPSPHSPLAKKVARRKPSAASQEPKKNTSLRNHGERDGFSSERTPRSERKRPSIARSGSDSAFGKLKGPMPSPEDKLLASKTPVTNVETEGVSEEKESLDDAMEDGEWEEVLTVQSKPLKRARPEAVPDRSPPANSKDEFEAEEKRGRETQAPHDSRRYRTATTDGSKNVEEKAWGKAALTSEFGQPSRKILTEKRKRESNGDGRRRSEADVTDKELKVVSKTSRNDREDDRKDSSSSMKRSHRDLPDDSRKASTSSTAAEALATPSSVSGVTYDVGLKTDVKQTEVDVMEKTDGASDNKTSGARNYKRGLHATTSNNQFSKANTQSSKVLGEEFRKLKSKMEATLTKPEPDPILFQHLARQTAITCFGAGLAAENEAKGIGADSKEFKRRAKDYYRYLEQKLVKTILQGLNKFELLEPDPKPVFYEAARAKAFMRVLALDTTFNTSKREECQNLLRKLEPVKCISRVKESNDSDLDGISFTRGEATQMRKILEEYTNAMEKLEVVMGREQEAGAECTVS